MKFELGNGVIYATVTEGGKYFIGLIIMIVVAIVKEFFGNEKK